MFFVAKELMGVPGLPTTTKGIRQALARFSSSAPEWCRKRSGSKAFEYNIKCLPESVQVILRERHIKQLMAAEPTDSTEIALPKAALKNKSPDAVRKIDIYRKCTVLMESQLSVLTEKQRLTADARMVLVTEVLRLELEGDLPRLKAINSLVSAAKANELPERLQFAAVNANAKRGNARTISRDPLYQWVLRYLEANSAAERLLLLAPGKRQEVKPEQISWLGDFLAHYRKPNGLSMAEAYENFKAEWYTRHADEPHMLAVCPSYDAIRRAMEKLPEVVKQRGRVTASEYRQIEGFVRRDWLCLPVNYVWIGDGHGMKLKCAHPVHGRPFSPEVTFVIDGSCRYLVGWSLDLSESVIAVGAAIHHGIRTHGKPFLYYSDNGSGETGDVLDADITGILPRLGIEHPTGIAGNPQGRGIIERLNRTLPMRIARQFATYYGKGADKETQRKLGKALQSAFNAESKGRELTTKQQNDMRKLPSWQQVVDAIEEGIEWYNNRPHSELPKKANGEHYSPKEFRHKKLADEGTEIEWLTDFELRDMFMPQVERKVSRCEIQWLNNIYYSPELNVEHGNKVLISYDIHNAERIIVRRLDGSYICEAVWDANKRAAFPISAEYHQRQQRIKGMRARGEEKIWLAEAENNRTLPAPSENARMVNNVYRPIGNTLAKAVEEIEDVYDDEAEAAFQRGVALLARKKAKDYDI